MNTLEILASVVMVIVFLWVLFDKKGDKNND